MTIAEIIQYIWLPAFILLGAGQVYLWADNRKLGNRVTKVESDTENIQTATGRTLARIDETMTKMSDCIHSIDRRLAKMEGRHESRQEAVG